MTVKTKIAAKDEATVFAFDAEGPRRGMGIAFEPAGVPYMVWQSIDGIRVARIPSKRIEAIHARLVAEFEREERPVVIADRSEQAKILRVTKSPILGHDIHRNTYVLARVKHGIRIARVPQTTMERIYDDLLNAAREAHIEIIDGREDR